jgi:hypothetical protein
MLENILSQGWRVTGANENEATSASAEFSFLVGKKRFKKRPGLQSWDNSIQFVCVFCLHEFSFFSQMWSSWNYAMKKLHQK